MVEQDDHGDPGSLRPADCARALRRRVGVRAGLGDDTVAAAVLPRFGGDQDHAVVVPDQRLGAGSGALAGSMSRSRVTWGGTVARALARRSRTARATGRRGWLAGRREYGRAGPEDALAVEDAVLVEGQGAGFKAMHGRGVDQFLGGFDVDVAEEGQRQVQGLGAHDSAAGGGAGLLGPADQELARVGRARGRRRGAWWTYGGDCMPRFGVLVLVVCVGGVLAAGAVGFFSRPSRRGRGQRLRSGAFAPDVPRHPRCRLPAAAFDSSGASTPAHPRPRHARLAGRSADTLLGRRGAWRVLRVGFRWKILPGRVNMAARAALFTHRGFALRDAAVLVGGARGQRVLSLSWDDSS